MLHLNGYVFAGAELTVEKYEDVPSISTEEMKKRLKAFLSNRFLPANKILNLQNLASDPILVEMGLFQSPTSETKFYQALMKVWSLEFPTQQAGRNAVENLSLANNGLSNITPITILSQNFPNLKALDLSNNNFQDEKALVGWRWKFRQLEFLDLSNNPFSSASIFKETLMKWYPRLKTLNNIPVRTDEEVAAQSRAPIPVQPPFFQDEGNIAETFIRNFFVGFDKDRNSTLNLYYDNNSSFSFNVNPAAPRGTQDAASVSDWDAWIKKSRNLKKLNHLGARMSRMYDGVEKIREVWNSIPQTQHPGLDQPAQWLIECHLMPCLPDATGQSPSGVGGFLVMIHGQFDESSGGKIETRSFDRTFILGPSPGPEKVKVISDMLTLRAYGGYNAWDINNRIDTAPATGAPPVHPEAPQGYGMPAPGKADVQVQQEQLVLQLSFTTNLKLEFSQQALVQHNWNIEGALRAFEESKVSNWFIIHCRRVYC
jgi:nuclear RNA export factor